MGETGPHKALRVSPEAQVLVKLGSLVTAAGALVVASIFVWQIKTNGETALAEIKAVREETKTMGEKVQRMWYDYERRYASHPSYPQPNP
jgi:hypothetical protein